MNVLDPKTYSMMQKVGLACGLVLLVVFTALHNPFRGYDTPFNFWDKRSYGAAFWYFSFLRNYLGIVALTVFTTGAWFWLFQPKALESAPDTSIEAEN